MAGAQADDLAVQRHRHGEHLGVIRAALGHRLIVQHLVGLALHQFLQLGLAVTAAALHHLLLLLIQQDAMDQRAGLVDAAVQIHRGQHRLHRVRQNGRTAAAAAALLALAQQQEVPQAQTLGHLVQALLAHQGGADTGQLALRQVGMLAVQKVRRHEAQHRVAQELQPLVAGDAHAAVLVGVGAVVQCAPQQLRIVEAIAQPLLQLM